MKGLKIEVLLRSASKASRNDPRQTPPPEYYLRRMNEDISTDSSSDSMSSASNFSEDDPFPEFEWLEQIDGVFINQDDENPEGMQVGYCDGKLIRREDIREKFWFAMEQPTEGTRAAAFDLFDRYGRLKPDFKDHPVKKGSGIWGSELDDGDIFLIGSLEIDEAYSRLGQRPTLVEAMLDKVRGKTSSFVAIVRPEDNLPLCKSSGSSKSTQRSISKLFWRSLGFRRIGSSSWFGLASDPEHPCHSLAIESDYEVPKMDSITLDADIEQKMKAILESGSDEDFVNFLSHVWGDTLEQDPQWTETDASGNSVMHLAATNIKPHSVQWILSRAESLLHRRNAQGETPLEALLVCLENIRTIRHSNALTEDISDHFTGFDDTAVNCLILLKGCTGTEVVNATRQRLKYGCTCGQCMSGFMSPRMRLALECQADIWSDFLREEIEDGEYWVADNESFLDWLPHRVKENLKTNSSMRTGVMNLCNHIATCLRELEIPNGPNVEKVLRDASEWPPASMNFLQRGGSISAVASMLFQRAMESDELTGDSLLGEEETRHLVKCRNDHEFGFAGTSRIAPNAAPGSNDKHFDIIHAHCRVSLENAETNRQLTRRFNQTRRQATANVQRLTKENTELAMQIRQGQSDIETKSKEIQRLNEEVIRLEKLLDAATSDARNVVSRTELHHTFLDIHAAAKSFMDYLRTKMNENENAQNLNELPGLEMTDHPWINTAEFEDMLNDPSLEEMPSNTFPAEALSDLK
ncbi:hypothetical protein N7478_010268 [Penicillium angulare]|uniref:uncharacterized protein n=1 Tax=Penicillium angulare TaxID=116970 RepID=UPI002541A4F2|nr:uncharacterized protein N7478_010268 [Penicillium angulare]KAJ5267460.1 hypothetical protein N7478_010268 [Penicillium angulare]